MTMGRPTKYSEEIQSQVDKYLQSCVDDNDIPFLEEIALLIDVDEDTIANWANAKYPEDYEEEEKRGQHKYPEFFRAYTRARTMQKVLLKKHGILRVKGSPKMEVFLLQANHSEVPVNRTEHTGADGGPIKNEGVIIMPPLAELDPPEDEQPDPNSSAA